jgi:SAM-dependent methyltransferase
MNPGHTSVHDSEWDGPTLDVQTVMGKLHPSSLVADCGCFGWTLAEPCRSRQLRMLGIDREEPAGRPNGAEFAVMEGPRLEVGDDRVDLVVASHVLEHLDEPMAFFREAVRIAVPGGLLWVESPSELSALGRGSDDPHDHSFASFWDDPTHKRPWTPGALYRLALSFRCVPLHVSRGVAGSIPVARMLARKPAEIHGAPPQAFVSLKDVPPGLEGAWASVWGDRGVVPGQG